MQDLILLVFIVKIAFEQLIGGKVRGMCGDAPTGNHLSTLPKSEKSLLLIENSRRLKECQAGTTRLKVCLYTSELI